MGPGKRLPVFQYRLPAGPVKHGHPAVEMRGAKTLRHKRCFLTAILLLVLAAPARPAEGRPKIGLVLGGGGAKGLVHIEVLKTLDALDIPIDCIAGTSAGGVIGGLYAAGYSGKDLEKIAAGIDWEDLFEDSPPRQLKPYFEKKLDGRYQFDFFLRKGIPTAPRGLIFGQKFYLLFSRLTFPLSGDLEFNELFIPFRCVSVDLVTGKQVVLQDGSLAKAMRATMAVPTVFTPVDWDDSLLIDGGALNNLPVDVAKAMGAEVVIAVDLSAPLRPLERLNTPDEILNQTLLAAEIGQKSGKMADVDILIQPDMKGLGLMDFFFSERLDKIREQGRIAAEKAIPALRALKEKYSLSRTSAARAEPLQEIPGLRADPSQPKVLDRVMISGNEKLPPLYISRLFSLRMGARVTAESLCREVSEIYSLGYFENIQYEVVATGQDKLGLRLILKELPRGRLRVGLGYDTFHKVIARGGVFFTNLPLPGMRFENELDLGGLTRFRSQLAFPSQTLDFPLYPSVQLNYKNVPTRIYAEDGGLITSYKDRSWAVSLGFGIQVKRNFNLEMSYRLEKLNAELVSTPERPERFQGLDCGFSGIALGVTVDTLDSAWTPRDGILARARYEGNFSSLGSDVHFSLAEASLDIYRNIAKVHTLRAYFYWGESSSKTPFLKFFNQGNPSAFVGLKYDQLLGSRMKIARAEYRRRLSGFLYLKAMGNAAFDVAQRWPENTVSARWLWGAGLGIMVTTPLGPLELIYSLGSKSFEEPGTVQGVTYLVLGARF
jgi:NTE family protein